MRPELLSPRIDDLRSPPAVAPEPIPWWASPSDPDRVHSPHVPPAPGNPWTLLQLIQPAFPPDGFAETSQLEEAHRSGLVRSSVDLAAFVGAALWEVGSLTLPFVRATRTDPAAHAVADGVCDAALRDPLTRRASSEKGQVFLGAVAAFSRPIAQLVVDARRRHLAGHLAPAFGAVAGLLGAGDDDACRLFLFLGARGIVSAAVRLGIVAPLARYAALSATAPTVNALIRHFPGPAALAAADGAPAERQETPTEPEPRRAQPPCPLPPSLRRIDYA